MKIVITESQLKAVIQEEVAAQEVTQQLQGQKDPRQIYRILAGAIKTGSLGIAMVPNMLANLFAGDQEGDKKSTMILKALQALFPNRRQSANNAENQQQMDPNLNEKVAAINEYMTVAAKNQNYDPGTIQISAEKMIDACNRTGFDLPLLIAQAHLESCFGLTPRARRTNSVFSVGSYDNGKDVCTYPTQNDSIVPYISLMQKNYLNGKSVDELLKPGAFVNQDNKRYASDVNYEKKVAGIRNKIKAKYPILST